MCRVLAVSLLESGGTYLYWLCQKALARYLLMGWMSGRFQKAGFKSLHLYILNAVGKALLHFLLVIPWVTFIDTLFAFRFCFVFHCSLLV